jgi:hypothetical protein
VLESPTLDSRHQLHLCRQLHLGSPTMALDALLHHADTLTPAATRDHPSSTSNSNLSCPPLISLHQSPTLPSASFKQLPNSPIPKLTQINTTRPHRASVHFTTVRTQCPIQAVLTCNAIHNSLKPQPTAINLCPNP